MSREIFGDYFLYDPLRGVSPRVRSVKESNCYIVDGIDAELHFLFLRHHLNSCMYESLKTSAIEKGIVLYNRPC